MKNLFARIFGSKDAGNLGRNVYYFSTDSTDAELELATEALREEIRNVIANSRKWDVYHQLSSKGWKELTQLTGLLVAANNERARRNAFLYH